MGWELNRGWVNHLLCKQPTGKFDNTAWPAGRPSTLGPVNTIQLESEWAHGVAYSCFAA